MIVHCRSWSGKGFMPSIRIGNSPCQNGRVHLGEGREAYEAACIEGRELLTQLEKE